MVGTGRAGARERRRWATPRWTARTLVAIAAAALVTGCGGATEPTPETAAAPANQRAEEPGQRPVPSPSSPGGEALAPGERERAARPADGPPPRVGSLVEDFPVDLLPVPEDAVLLVTSAVPVGGSAVREVSLNLRTRLTVEAVLSLYREELTGAGFTEVGPPTDESGPTADATFTRSGGDELVTIGVVDDDGTRTLTLGGRVRTGEDS
jgi:hypothetical protein